MSHGGGGGISDLAIIIIILFLLFFVWLASGGKSHEATTKGPFIKPYTDPSGPFETYDN